MNETKRTTPSASVTGLTRLANENWRERFLRSVMIGALVFGLIALIPNALQAPSAIFLAIYVVAYIVLGIITFTPLHYNYRAGTLLFLIYGLGIVGLTQDGLWGDARLFFLTFIGMSLLLFSTREGVIAILLSLLTLFVGEWLLTSGLIMISSPEIAVVGSPGVWITSATILLLLAVVFVTGLHILRQDFVKAQDQARATLEELRKERTDLEVRVQERTAGLARKTEQLRATSFVARQTAAVQEVGRLLQSAVESITEQFGYYHAALFLIDERGDQITLQAASSDGGKQMLKNNYAISLTNKTDPIARTASQGKAQVVLNAGEIAAQFDNQNLPITRSQILLPIVLRDKVMGVLDIQTKESNAFIKDDIDVFQSLADHIAIAIENARLLNETQTILMQLEAVNVARTGEAWTARLKSKSQAYTYTTMGVRPEKPSEEDANSLKVPIALRGHEIGAIALSRKEGEEWGENEQSLVSKVAGQVSLAIDNLRLLEEAQRSAARDQTLTNVSNKIRETLNMETILQSAAREFQRALNLKEAEIRLGLPDMDNTASPITGTPRTKVNTGTLRTRVQDPIRKKK